MDHTGRVCVSFKYHLYGSSFGSLELYKTRRGEAPEENPISTLSGEKGNEWMSQTVETSLSADDRVRCSHFSHITLGRYTCYMLTML